MFGALGLKGLFDGFKDTEREQRSFLNRALESNARANAERQALEAQARLANARGLQQIRQGFTSALGATRAAGQTARTAAGRSAATQSGRIQQNAFNRGLVGTSAGNALNTAAQRRTNEAFAGVDAQLAALESQLFGNQGRAEAQQLNNLASLLTQQGQAGTQSANDLARILGSVDIQDGSLGFLQALAGIAGSFSGGLGGRG